jgi:putative transposase
VVKVSGRGSGRISVAGLACLKPGRPGRFFYRVQGHRLRPGTRRAMTEADYAGLITAAHRYLNAPVIVIWDNLPTHLSRKMQAFTTGHREWLTVVRLPAYTPDLNPAEMSLPQCELRRSLVPWLPGSLSSRVSIGVPSSVQRRRLW